MIEAFRNIFRCGSRPGDDALMRKTRVALDSSARTFLVDRRAVAVRLGRPVWWAPRTVKGRGHHDRIAILEAIGGAIFVRHSDFLVSRGFRTQEYVLSRLRHYLPPVERK